MVHEKRASVIIGCPTFDMASAVSHRISDNDNTVFVYNPHYEMYLTCWRVFGRADLGFFATNPQYNLVFHLILRSLMAICPESWIGMSRIPI